jgi:hypothetical protein
VGGARNYGGWWIILGSSQFGKHAGGAKHDRGIYWHTMAPFFNAPGRLLMDAEPAIVIFFIAISADVSFSCPSGGTT